MLVHHDAHVPTRIHQTMPGKVVMACTWTKLLCSSQPTHLMLPLLYCRMCRLQLCRQLSNAPRIRADATLQPFRLSPSSGSSRLSTLLCLLSSCQLGLQCHDTPFRCFTSH